MKTTTLPKLRDWNPTSWDSRSNYMGDTKHDDWHVAPVCLTRDSDVLTRANWQELVRILKADKIKGCEIHRFGHWACGWYELVLISPTAEKTLERAEDIAGALQDYPVISDDVLYDLEYQDEQEYWENSLSSDLIHHIEEKFTVETSDGNFDWCEAVNVNNDALYAYFMHLCDTGNVRIEHESGGPYFNLDLIADLITLESVIEHLPGIKLPSALLDTLPHAFIHRMYAENIPFPMLPDGTAWKGPNCIAVQYDKRQEKLL